MTQKLRAYVEEIQAKHSDFSYEELLRIVGLCLNQEIIVGMKDEPREKKHAELDRFIPALKRELMEASAEDLKKILEFGNKVVLEENLMLGDGPSEIEFWNTQGIRRFMMATFEHQPTLNRLAVMEVTVALMVKLMEIDSHREAYHEALVSDDPTYHLLDGCKDLATGTTDLIKFAEKNLDLKRPLESLPVIPAEVTNEVLCELVASWFPEENII